MSLRQESFLPWLDRRTLAVGIISVAAVTATYLVTDAWKTTHAGEPPAPQTLGRALFAPMRALVGPADRGASVFGPDPSLAPVHTDQLELTP